MRCVEAFVEHPDFGDDDFKTKLKGQMQLASPPAWQLMAEMLWALLLFPSNMKATTKRQQIQDIWTLSGQKLPADHPLMRDEVLIGIGSGGPGFNNYRPVEMTFLIVLTENLKRRKASDRQRIFADYETFIKWMASVPREGFRQFRHMLRYFAFPDRVERMSSNRDRRQILEAFGIASQKEIRTWLDQQLDDALLTLRGTLQRDNPSAVFDFYAPEIKEQWAWDRKIKTIAGEVTVVIPVEEEEEEEDAEPAEPSTKTHDTRKSLQVQAKLAEIGTVMGFNIWIPGADRNRIYALVPERERRAFLEELPLNYDVATLDTIKQIDVLWLKGRSIVQAFEVEHTTAVYSGLLRMADLLALQPNMNIRLHIVAPDERREKVLREMQRPVFSLLDRGPLSDSCSFISYESVDAIHNLDHLAHTNASITEEYEERLEG